MNIKQLFECLSLALATLFVVNHGKLAWGDEPKAKLLLEFDSGKFDRSLWSLNRESPPGVTMTPREKTLRIVIPPGPAGRPPAEVKGRFKIEGAFELKMDYQIQSLPKPQKEWINIAILVGGAGGLAAVYRTNNYREGQGYSAWTDSGEGREKKNYWVHKPTEDLRGTLRLVRTGSRLVFEAAGPDGEFRKVATREYGRSPIDTVGFHIMATPAVAAPIDVTFANISVKADKIVATPDNAR
jgi:hypothetical protein